MDNDEDIARKLRKFSVVKQCPKCGQLSMEYVNGKIMCSGCGFEQNVLKG
ncbi:MAG TPA: hypothetical protein VJI97_03850 [Candidatus Nanoarchaeia archaeon]|nr:hypothetical protein [Candidatus Nanoarchaeia archaeon]